jgi:type II secretory pathway component PulJ
MNRSSFTLLEVLISIVLLVIIILFLYQALDITKVSNTFFHKKLSLQEDKTRLKKIFFNDIAHCESNTTKISEDNDKNSILQLKSTNTYHNSFYNYITYLLSKEGNLIRTESKTKFDKNKLFDDFFDKAYVDILFKDIEKFKVIKKTNQQYAVYIKFKDETDMMFLFKSMR